jgi:hypothetical protein
MFGIEELKRHSDGRLIAQTRRQAYPEEMELLGLELVEG